MSKTISEEREERLRILKRARRYFWLTSIPIIKWFFPYQGLCTYSRCLSTSGSIHIDDRMNMKEIAEDLGLFDKEHYRQEAYWFPKQNARARYEILDTYISHEFEQ